VKAGTKRVEAIDRHAAGPTIVVVVIVIAGVLVISALAIFTRVVSAVAVLTAFLPATPFVSLIFLVVILVPAFLIILRTSGSLVTGGI
jgi:hypothetical protein